MIATHCLFHSIMNQSDVSPVLHEKKATRQRIKSVKNASVITRELSNDSNTMKSLYLMCISCARVEAIEYPVHSEIGIPIWHQPHGTRHICMTTCRKCMNVTVDSSHIPLMDSVDYSLLTKVPFSIDFILQSPVYQRLCQYEFGSVEILTIQHGVLYIPLDDVSKKIDNFCRTLSIKLIDGRLVIEKITTSLHVFA
jgi:hypothetical protein